MTAKADKSKGGRRMGRPPRNWQSLGEKIAAEIEAGMTARLAAAAHDVPWPTYCLWRKKHPKFQAMIDRAFARAMGSAQKRLFAATESTRTYVDRRRSLKDPTTGRVRIVRETITKRENLRLLDAYMSRIEAAEARHAAEEAARDTFTGPPPTIEAAMARLGYTGESWRPWRTAARLLDGTELDDYDLQILRDRTGLEAPPPDPVRELWGVIGRRGGKSQFAAVVAVTRACRRYERIVKPEIPLIARTMQQGRILADYCRDVADRLGLLGEKSSSYVIPIRDGCTVRVQPNTSSVRGGTYPAIICDEIAHYQTNPAAAWSDRDLLTAVRPGMATVRSPLFLGISSPWKRQGVLADAHKGWQSGDRKRGTIVWHGPTRAMNPTISQERIDDEIAAFPALAAEFSAEFFAEGGVWIPPHLLADEKVRKWPISPAPTDARRENLFAFADAASGGGADSFALCIAERIIPKTHDWLENREVDHPENRRARLVEILHVPPPFDPETDAVARAAEVLKRYGLNHVVGDRWAQGMQDVVWRKHGISYEKIGMTRSDIYHETLPAFLSGRVDLLKDQTLVEQLRNLIEVEGREAPATIDHPAGEHDDVANSACGALMLALSYAEFAGA